MAAIGYDATETAALIKSKKGEEAGQNGDS
jgi:hypothetical protein